MQDYAMRYAEQVIGQDAVYVPGNPLTLTLPKRSHDSVHDENQIKRALRTTNQTMKGEM